MAINSRNGRYIGFSKLSNGGMSLYWGDEINDFSCRIGQTVNWKSEAKVVDVAVFKNFEGYTFTTGYINKLFPNYRLIRFTKILKYAKENLDLVYCTKGMFEEAYTTRRVLIEKNNF